jgi:hypothetical protein
MSRTQPRRRSVVTCLATMAAAMGVVTVTGVNIAQAVVSTTTPSNTCQGITGTISDLPIPISVDAPASVTLGAGNLILSGISVTVAVTPELVAAGINAGVVTPAADVASLNAGNVNEVTLAAGAATLKVNGSNTSQGTQTTSNPAALAFQFWAVQAPSGAVSVYIDTDPGAGFTFTSVPAIPINVALTDLTFTPTGGNVVFTQPLILPTVSGGVATPIPADATNAPLRLLPKLSGLTVPFTCWLGTGNVPATGSFTPATSAAVLASTVVIAPPTAPVCTNPGLAPSVPAGQSVTLDFTTLCTDVNGNNTIVWNSIGFGFGDPAAPTLCVPAELLAAGGSGVCTLPTGTLTPQISGGVFTGQFTYANTDTSATQELFGFTVGDNSCADPADLSAFVPYGPTGCPTGTTQRRSGQSIQTVTILQGECQVQGASCDVTQIVQVSVAAGTPGLSMRASTSAAVQLSNLTLNGDYQIASGNLNTMTVENRRGSSAAWSLVGQASDLKASGFTGACPNRLCIPATNLSWQPAVSLVPATRIPGDVGAIVPGSSGSATTPWTTGLGSNPTISATSTLCSAATGVSGGTFTCAAPLKLGVPASAGAGTYTGTIVLTLA